MPSTMPNAPAAVISADRRTRTRLAKAHLRKAEKADWIALGRVIARTQVICGLSLKEFADAIGRNERQVARWMLGTEQGQAAPILAVARLRQPFLIALAEHVGVCVETVIRVKSA